MSTTTRKCLLYWPGISADIRILISHCELCSQFSQKQQKETIMPHDLPQRPWEKVFAYLCTIQGKDYLIFVDYFSNFWEINRLRDIKASIYKLKTYYSPAMASLIVTVNGLQFTFRGICWVHWNVGLNTGQAASDTSKPPARLNPQLKQQKTLYAKQHTEVETHTLSYLSMEEHAREWTPAQHSIC